MDKKKKISKEEAEVYDRQIRLWGLEAQNRLRNSNVLLVGLGGLGAEVAKNLMLSGMKSLTLMDDKNICPNDFASQFLINGHSENEWSQALNPMVEVRVDEGSVDSKPDDFFRQFDLVILTDQKYDSVNRVDKICRLHNIKFQAGGVFGWAGYSFSDFNNQTFLVPKPKTSEDTVLSDSDDDNNGDGEPAGKRFKKNGNGVEHKHDIKPAITLEDEEEVKMPQKISFSSFDYAMNTNFTSKRMLRVTRSRASALPSSYFPVRALLRTLNEGDGCTAEELEKRWKEEVNSARMEEAAGHPSLEDFNLWVYRGYMPYLGPQLSPVCAIIGGIIGQEAIKAISQDGVPFKNLFLYSALDTTGIVSNLPLTG